MPEPRRPRLRVPAWYEPGLQRLQRLRRLVVSLPILCYFQPTIHNLPEGGGLLLFSIFVAPFPAGCVLTRTLCAIPVR